MIINKGDIIEVYDDENLTYCQSCIGIVEKISHCFVIFKVAKILQEDELMNSIPIDYQDLVHPLIKRARGQIRATTLENIIRHTPTVPLEYAHLIKEGQDEENDLLHRYVQDHS